MIDKLIDALHDQSIAINELKQTFEDWQKFLDDWLKVDKT